jgi:hypothetical protein
MIGLNCFFAVKRYENGSEAQVSKSVILQEFNNKRIIWLYQIFDCLLKHNYYSYSTTFNMQRINSEARQQEIKQIIKLRYK